MLSDADVGTQISVKVSYIDGHGTSEGPLTSTRTSPVVNVEVGATRFFVVDQSSRRTYEYDAAGTPSTHTTFLITEQLKGDHQSNEITLVQAGGPSQTDSDKIMMVSTARYFTVGEEELLFMNLDFESPVESSRSSVVSRFRVYQDKIYNEDGYGMRVVTLNGGTQYTLVQSRDRNPADRFKRITIGPHRLDKNFSEKGNRSADAKGTVGTRHGNGINRHFQSTEADAFSALIRR